MPVNRPSLARNLFDQILADPVTVLRGMVESESRAVESEWLEFKGYPVSYFKDRFGGLDSKNLKDPKSDPFKEIWSEVLSAFANTQGGLLVWGIHAAKEETGIDAAAKFIYVPNPELLATRLVELQHQATDPPISGVVVRPVVDTTIADGSGFVVCYVPESPDAPHRARYKGDQFYHRSIDKSVVMPIPVLRRLFYPQSQPRFLITATLGFQAQGWQRDRIWRFEFQAEIENVGMATAKNVMIGMNQEGPLGGQVYANPPWMTPESHRYRRTFITGTHIHPGFASKFMFATYWNVKEKRVVEIEGAGQFYRPDFDTISAEFVVFAENFEPQIHCASFPAVECGPDDEGSLRKVCKVSSLRFPDLQAD